MFEVAERQGFEAGLVIREREPLNLEYPFEQLDDLLTPNDLFYIRSHFKPPVIDPGTYLLTVQGAVKTPLSVSYADLRAMPSVTKMATLECAGNSRIFLVPQVKGAQWQMGAVSTAEWTGVPLSALLERAGMDAGACEVLFEAADSGKPKEEPIPPGDTSYSRSVSMAKAADIIIAYAMNGEDLSLDHGFPVRVVVPGHYGMAAVKWLTCIRVLTEPYKGYWQTSDYAYWKYDEHGNPMRLALGEMSLKSAIARPRTREIIQAGSTYRVFGAAWCGESTVQQVDVSTDDGNTWQPAHFLDEAQPFVWRRWQFEWQVPDSCGMAVLQSRAMNAVGNTQPQQHDARFGTYVIHHTFGIEVLIR